MTRVTLVGPNTEGKLSSAMETVMETTQDFTDSAYTSHENRERILVMCERVRSELGLLLRIGVSLVSLGVCVGCVWHICNEFTPHPL